MARKIGVLDLHQSPNETPRTFLKKSVALMLVRRLLAEQITEHVIRYCAVKQAAKVFPVEHGSPYIPDYLPSESVHSIWLKFIPPAQVTDSSVLRVQRFKYANY